MSCSLEVNAIKAYKLYAGCHSKEIPNEVPAVFPSIVSKYVRMYPREIFDERVPGPKTKSVTVADTLDILANSGVYILYRDDQPYYIGKTAKLRERLRSHACKPGSKYDLFWNHFSAFVVPNPKHMAEVEAMLIAAIPTANGAQPKLDVYPYPPAVTRVIRVIRLGRRLD